MKLNAKESDYPSRYHYNQLHEFSFSRETTILSWLKFQSGEFRSFGAMEIGGIKDRHGYRTSARTHGGLHPLPSRIQPMDNR